MIMMMKKVTWLNDDNFFVCLVFGVCALVSVFCFYQVSGNIMNEDVGFTEKT
ncbi:hypothetical protein ACE6H2_018522 [Prunus campanulata]